MLHVIRDTSDPLVRLIADDPVRPNIPVEQRIGFSREVLVSMQDGEPTAVVCVSYQDSIPEDEAGLCGTADPSAAIFYTIWSYAPGAGRDMIFAARDHIRANWPTVTRFVTLSPQTEMARKFHLRNGAVVFRDNSTSVNYEYL
jgi:hypothetical protein